MRIAVSPRSRLCARVAAFTMIAASAAGCSSDSSRFKDNPFSSPMAARQGPPARDVTGSVPTNRVDSQPLPPPSRPMVSSTGVVTGGGGMGNYQPDPPRTRLSENVSREPMPLHAPTGVAAAPPPPRYTPAPAPAPVSVPRAMHAPSTVHVVTKGQTIASIARIYSKPGVEIAQANRLTLGAKLHAGQRVMIPGGAKGVKTASVAPVVAAPPAQPPAKPVVASRTPLSTPTAAPVPPAVQAKAPTAAPTRVASTDPTIAARVVTPANETPEAATDPNANPTFRWPVRGRVIGAFGAKINGQQNDGINLSVPEGTSVKAAEDGVVAYSGNELKGYGNLVLVRHSSGFVTAYAHASEIMVKRGDKVKRGQIIAKAGQTGGVTSPQLHFEIRKGSTPVDPMQHLSSGT